MKIKSHQDKKAFIDDPFSEGLPGPDEFFIQGNAQADIAAGPGASSHGRLRDIHYPLSALFFGMVFEGRPCTRAPPHNISQRFQRDLDTLARKRTTMCLFVFCHNWAHRPSLNPEYFTRVTVPYNLRVELVGPMKKNDPLSNCFLDGFHICARARYCVGAHWSSETRDTAWVLVSAPPRLRWRFGVRRRPGVSLGWSVLPVDSLWFDACCDRRRYSVPM